MASSKIFHLGMFDYQMVTTVAWAPRSLLFGMNQSIKGAATQKHAEILILLQKTCNICNIIQQYTTHNLRHSQLTVASPKTNGQPLAIPCNHDHRMSPIGIVIAA